MPDSCFATGSVTYDVTGWAEENADRLTTQVLRALASSGCSTLVQPTYMDTLAQADVSMQATVVSSFQSSLDRLMGELQGPCSFVRCLRPSVSGKAGLWQPMLVLEQLCHLGVVDTIRSCREGFTIRWSGQHFMEHYAVLIAGAQDASEAVQLLCSTLLSHPPYIGTLVLGTSRSTEPARSMVFAKVLAHGYLETERAKHVNHAAATFGPVFIAHLRMQQYQQGLAACEIQSVLRGVLGLRLRRQAVVAARGEPASEGATSGGGKDAERFAVRSMAMKVGLEMRRLRESMGSVLSPTGRDNASTSDDAPVPSDEVATVSADTEDAIKATVSQDTQHAIKAGLLGAQLQENVSPGAQDAIRAALGAAEERPAGQEPTSLRGAEAEATVNRADSAVVKAAHEGDPVAAMRLEVITDQMRSNHIK